MTPSPRSFSTISVAIIVLSATLSVFLSPDRSVAQSTADVTTVSLISPHPLTIPIDSTKIACRASDVKKCQQDAVEECKLTKRLSVRYNQDECLFNHTKRCMIGRC